MKCECECQEGSKTVRRAPTPAQLAALEAGRKKLAAKKSTKAVTKKAKTDPVERFRKFADMADDPKLSKGMRSRYFNLARNILIKHKLDPDDIMSGSTFDWSRASKPSHFF